MNVRPNEKLPVQRYKSDNRKWETFGLKPLYNTKEKLMNLNFDFTSLHEFLNNARFVMNQHAKLLNSLRNDIITK